MSLSYSVLQGDQVAWDEVSPIEYKRLLSKGYCTNAPGIGSERSCVWEMFKHDFERTKGKFTKDKIGEWRKSFGDPSGTGQLPEVSMVYGDHLGIGKSFRPIATFRFEFPFERVCIFHNQNYTANGISNDPRKVDNVDSGFAILHPPESNTILGAIAAWAIGETNAKELLEQQKERLKEASRSTEERAALEHFKAQDEYDQRRAKHLAAKKTSSVKKKAVVKKPAQSKLVSNAKGREATKRTAKTKRAKA